MPRRFRPPMFVIAAALLGLIALLATLQYQWLGRISDAERERMTVNAERASIRLRPGFRSRAHARVHAVPVRPVAEAGHGELSPARLATRTIAGRRWRGIRGDQGRLRRLRADDGDAAAATVRRCDRFVEPAEWPAAHDEPCAQIDGVRHEPGDARAADLVRASMTAPLWDDVPALVVPMPHD